MDPVKILCAAAKRVFCEIDEALKLMWWELRLYLSTERFRAALEQLCREQGTDPQSVSDVDELRLLLSVLMESQRTLSRALGEYADASIAAKHVLNRLRHDEARRIVAIPFFQWRGDERIGFDFVHSIGCEASSLISAAIGELLGRLRHGLPSGVESVMCLGDALNKRRAEIEEVVDRLSQRLVLERAAMVGSAFAGERAEEPLERRSQRLPRGRAREIVEACREEKDNHHAIAAALKKERDAVAPYIRQLCERGWLTGRKDGRKWFGPFRATEKGLAEAS